MLIKINTYARVEMSNDIQSGNVYRKTSVPTGIYRGENIRVSTSTLTSFCRRLLLAHSYAFSIRIVIQVGIGVSCTAKFKNSFDD